MDAVIIPFPSRTPEASPDRLAAALLNLQSALDEQRRALHDWRFAMTELGIGVAGLGHSLGAYQEALGDVEVKLTSAHEAATQLENWADAVIEGRQGDLPPAVATPRDQK
jgi:uncharacterized membrane protein YccC